MTQANISGAIALPNTSIVNTTTAEMAAPGAGRASVTMNLPVGPLNDLGTLILGARFRSGLTYRFILTPATNSGNGTTINGLDASGCDDNFQIFIQNPSTTDPIIFTHLNVGSLAANRFSNVNGGSVQIPPLGAARAYYVINVWQFA